ncbi:MAG: hypothetical protein DHS20C07_05310 [Methyloligella sp.]|nr:MAG: hypothetical protein DHS20C07_05310 [Methyloligella sp.]
MLITDIDYNKSWRDHKCDLQKPEIESEHMGELQLQFLIDDWGLLLKKVLYYLRLRRFRLR